MWKCRMWTKKPLARNENLIQTKKPRLEWAVNWLKKPFRKKSDPKNRKTENQSEIAACEQKNHYRETEFLSNTIFALYFKIRAKKIHAAKPLAFSLHFLFRREQNHYSQFDFKNHENVWTDLKKNIAGQVLTYNSKNFHWLNRNTRPRMDYEWIEKTIFKKSDQKIRKKNKKNNVKMPHVNKKTTSEKRKFNSNKKPGLEWAVNGLKKPFRKKSDPKNRKKQKIRVKLPHVNKKPLPRNRIFVKHHFRTLL